MSAPATPAGGFRSWRQAIDEYWFAKGSPTAMGVLRIFLGFLAFANLLMLATGFSDWFGPKSFVPLTAADAYMPPLGKEFTLFGLEKLFHINPALPFNFPRLNLLSGTEDVYLTAGFYLLVTIAAFLTMIGLWTKLSSTFLAIGIVTLHHRNGLILHGGDTVLRIGVLYLALSPCGLACSVDRLRALAKGKVGPEAPQVSMWTQRLVQYNLALIYFTTFWGKLGYGSHWRDLTATYYSAHLNEFHKFWVPEFVNQPPMIYVTTAVTLVVELSLGTLVFYKPARKAVLISGLILHASIEYSMNIPLFAFLICSLYISFYSGEEIAGFFARLGKRLSKFAIQIHLPAGKRLRPAAANMLAAMDPLHLVTYVPGSDPEWDPKAIRKSWTHSLGAWTIGWAPRLWMRVLNRALEPEAPKGARA